jgi:hypothetical protein
MIGKLIKLKCKGEYVLRTYVIYAIKRGGFLNKDIDEIKCDS